MSSETGLETLINQARGIGEEANASFGHFSAPQLNWKPGADRWSIAQCFDHLVVTNQGYFPMFDQIIQGEKKTSLLERLPVLPSLWGKLVTKSLDPNTTRKLKAPKNIQPATSDIEKQILSDFVNQQQRIVDYMTRMKGLDLDRIIVTSPILAIMTYSLKDALRIIVVHERRHFMQAQNVATHQGFPH